MPDIATTENTDYERYKEEVRLDFTASFNTPIPDNMNAMLYAGTVTFSHPRLGYTDIDFLSQEIHPNEPTDGHPFRLSVMLTTLEETVTSENNDSMEHILSADYLKAATIIGISHEFELFGEPLLFEDCMCIDDIKLSLIHHGEIEHLIEYRNHAIGVHEDERQRLLRFLHGRQSFE